jgi:hypothetical protein
MKKKDPAPAPDDSGSEDAFAEAPEDNETSRLRDLYNAHDLLYWKIELHELLHGERASEIIQTRGSAADYLKTRFSLPNETIDRYFCMEALNEFLKETSLPLLSPSALNHLLDLIAEFQPRNGFSSIVTCLRMEGKVESSFIPVGGAVAFDLHQKTLETLGTYFEVAHINYGDPAFLTYVEILRQQILDPKYRGYAAFELLKLEVLQPDSKEFKLLVTQYPDSLNVILLSLSMYASNGYGHGDIRKLFYVCLDSGKEVFNKFLDAIKSSGGTLEPTEQENPLYLGQTIETPTLSLRLFEGTIISINLEEKQVNLYSRYRYEDDTQIDVNRLLMDPSLGLIQKEERLTKLFIKSCAFDRRGIELFVEDLSKGGAVLINAANNNKIYVEYKGSTISINLGDVPSRNLQTYLNYIKHAENIPSNPSEIKKSIDRTVAESESVFVAEV